MRNYTPRTKSEPACYVTRAELSSPTLWRRLLLESGHSLPECNPPTTPHDVGAYQSRRFRTIMYDLPMLRIATLCREHNIRHKGRICPSFFLGE